MSLLNTQKISTKLILNSMLTTVLAILILGIASLSKMNESLTENQHKSTRSVVKQIIDQTEVNFVFESPIEDENLEDFLIPHEYIKKICIYRAIDSGQSFEQFYGWASNNFQSDIPCPDQVQDFTLLEDGGHYGYGELIRSDSGEELLGLITVVSSNQSISESLQTILKFIGIIVVLTIILSMVISALLAKVIAEPIRHLSETSMKIGKEQDFSLRAEKETDDELGTLVDSFNDMLSTIERQNSDLLNSKDKLRDLVTALQESEEHFRAIFEKAGDSIMLIDTETGRFYEYNELAHRTLGYNREEFSRLKIIDIEYLNYGERDDSVRLTDAHIPDSFETQMVSKNKKILDVLVSAKDIVIRKRPFRVLIVRDITEQKRIDQEIIALNSRMRAVLDSATQVAIIATDMDGLITVFNRGAELLLNYDKTDVISRKTLTLLHLETELKAQQQRIATERGLKCSLFDSLTERVKRVGVETGRWTYVSSKGEQIPVQLTITGIRDNIGELQGYLCMASDLRERISEEEKRSALEAQLQQSQKMETIGTLAGGIAHDLNNLLTPIVGYTEMVMQDIDEKSSDFRRLSHVIKGAIRARELVKQILTFSHQVKHQTKAIKPKSIISEVTKLLTASLPPSVILKANYDAPDVVVQADATQIHQVLMNLCTNAAHAMGKEGGNLNINLSSQEVTSEDAYLKLEPGKYVVIQVADTGCGMSEDTLKRIFEPFFTTKDVGEGTGLGLSVAHGIIKSHNGQIHAYSELGVGTTFTIYLPEVEDKVTEIGKPSDIKQGSARVLYVDDEPEIAEMACEMLKRQGYTLTMAVGSVEGLKTFESAPESFDIVISDQTMPEMTGTEMAEKIHAQRSDIPIVLVTGLGSIMAGEALERIGIVDVVTKPVVASDLSEAITKALKI